MLLRIRSNPGPLILLLLILLGTTLVRWRHLDLPLERDEGEYAYMGQLILQGIPPYAEAYNMKFPGIYGLYALTLAVFGETAWSVHFALMLFTLSSIVLCYLLASSWLGRPPGVVAAGSFALFTLSHHLHGFWANAEHFVIPFVVLGFLLLANSQCSSPSEPRRWSCSPPFEGRNDLIGNDSSLPVCSLWVSSSLSSS
jgi:4-amino-4-deoxy-L-arabinose transferase-like glycosyltransferase